MNNSNSYQDFIQQRGIHYLVHFTKSNNLPFIFGTDEKSNGILSSEKVEKLFGSKRVWDKQRFDNHKGYVCCSIEQISYSYYKRRTNEEKQDPFNQWAVVYIDPRIINDTTCFAPFNAATRSGAYIKNGIDAFKHLFDQEVTGTKANGQKVGGIRNVNIKANLPTNNNAEVLIKSRIPKKYLIGVAFPDNSKEVEIERMKFWENEDIKVAKNFSYCMPDYNGGYNG